MKKLYTFCISLFFIGFSCQNMLAQCNVVGQSISQSDACGDGSTTVTIILTFDADMTAPGGAANVVLTDGTNMYVGGNGMPGPMDVQFDINPTHSMVDGCNTESYTYSIDPSSVCDDGVTAVGVGSYIDETVTVYPLQPSWEIAAGSEQVCDLNTGSNNMITLNILDNNGVYCTEIMIPAPANQTCFVENTVNVDIDYESILGISGPISLGCWTNVVATDFTMDPGGTMFEVYPEQPTWEIAPGSEEVCSGGMMNLNIYDASGNLCSTTAITVPVNQTCDAITDFDITGLIDFEALLGITGPIGEGCWVNPSGSVSVDDFGNAFWIYPEQFTWEIDPGVGGVICDGDDFSFNILAADGSQCATGITGLASYTPNDGCALETSITMTIDYSTYVNTQGGNGIDAVCGATFIDESGTYSMDPGGTNMSVLPQSLQWIVDPGFSPLAVCGDGASTVPIVLQGANGCLSGVFNLPTPQNTECVIDDDYPVDITLTDMETMLGFVNNELTSTTCFVDINDFMNNEISGNIVEVHPDEALLGWQVVAGMPLEYCSAVGDVTVELTMNGVACPGATFDFAIPFNDRCTVVESLPITIDAVEIETALGITTSATCYTGIADNIMNDPNGYLLQVLPEPFIVVDDGTAAQSCSDDPNVVSVILQAADGTNCGSAFMFDAPTNRGCGTISTYTETITVDDIATVLGISAASAGACYVDLPFDESLFSSFEVFPLMPMDLDVTVLNATPCSEDTDILEVDIVAADGSICPAAILIDAPLIDGCVPQPDILITVTVAEIENALGIPAGLCPSYMDLQVVFPITINPAPPSAYMLAGPVPGAVCSGAENPVVVNIIAANGVDVCDAVEIDAPINDGCEPFDDHIISFLYTSGQWSATTGATSACGFGSFSDDYMVDVYPEPFTLDTTGGGECGDLVAMLVAADGTTCYTQMYTCAGDTDMMMYDFNDPAAAAEYGDLIPWDVTQWPAACAPPASHFAGTMECLNCPEICGFSGAYPYWTSYCPDAFILCDFSQFDPIMTCTPPVSVEDDDCEPEGNLCNGASTADNMSWFAFIAGSTTIDINFLQLSCESGNSFQAGIWDECICNGGSCLVGQSSPCATNIDLLLTNAIIGETYYMFLDGCGGSQCNINITIEQAPPFVWDCPEEQEVDNCDLSDYDFAYTENTFCVTPDGSLTLLFEQPIYNDFIGTLNSTFTWSITSSNGYIPVPFDMANPLILNDPFVEIEIPESEVGDYTICFERADNDCDDTDDCVVPQCVDIQVVLLPDQDWGVQDVCFDVLEQEGYFPDMPPDGTWFWQGPPIFTTDLNANGSYEFTAVNECGCEFIQTIQINVIDELFPIPYTVYLCEEDPCVPFPTQYGTIQFCIDDALDELIWLEGLAPSGCDLPVYLTVTGLIMEGDVDTISLSCNSLELDWNVTNPTPIDFDQDDMSFIWTNMAGDTIGTESQQFFDVEGMHCLEVTYWIYNEFNEYKECSDVYCYDIKFDEITVAAPTFIDPVLVLCPGVPQTIDYTLFDRGDNNTWTSTPPGLIVNVSGPNNTVATVDWDGVSGGRLCAQADATCDGVFAESELTCIDIIVTPVQTYTTTVQDTICELMDSVLVTFNGDVAALDSIAWDNGESTESTYYQLTASGGYQYFEVFAIDTFGCEFPVIRDSVYVDDEKFLTISVPQPIVCLDPGVDVSFLVSTTGPGVLTPQPGLDINTGIFDPAVAGAGTYTFEFTGTPADQFTDGCVADTVTANVRIVDTPQPAFTLESPICLGTTADVTVNPADTVGGIVYTWQTPNAVSSLAGDNTMFDLSYSSSGMYDVTLVTSVGQCISDPLVMQVEVLDTLTFPPFSCIGQGRDFINFEWTVPNGVTEFNVSWTINGIPAAGSPTVGPDNTLNVTGLAESDEVIVTVTATDPNGCGDKTRVATCVALNCDEPGLFLATPVDICLDGSVTSITLVPEWNGPDPEPTNGGPIGFSGAGVDPVTGEFTVTTAGVFDISYQYRDSIGCTFFATAPVTVLNPPTAALVSADTICLGDRLNLQFNGNTVGVDFVWDFDNDIFNDQSAMNNSNINIEWDTPGTKNITVNTTLNTTTTPCSAMDNKTVVVLDTIPAPVFDPCGAAGRDFVTFSWQDVFSVNDNIPVTEYMVTVDGVPLGVQDSTYLVVNGLAEAQTVTIVVTALDPNGCNDQSSSFDCTSLFCRHDYVLPLSPAAVLCSNVDTVPFSIIPDLSQIPSNEVGSGVFTVDPANGMIDDQGTFDPSGLAAGVYTVEYVYTNIIGCVDPFTVDITINDEPSASFALPQNVCVGDNARIIYGGDATGVTFTWDIGGATSSDLAGNPQSTNFSLFWDTPGIKTVTLTTERNGCINTSTEMIEVIGPANITLSGPAGPTCFDNSGIQLGVMVTTQTGSFIGDWLDPAVDDVTNIFTPPSGNNATYNLVYQVTEEGCVTTATQVVEVLASPSIDVNTVTQNICVNGVAQVGSFATGQTTITWDLDGGTLVGGDINSTGPLDIMWDTPGTYTVSATVENGICTATDSDQVIVEPRLDLLNIICDEEITSITFSWNEVDCVDEYIIEVDGVIVETNYTDETYTVTGLTEEQTVDFVVTTLSMCACPGDRNPAECTSLPCPDFSVDFSTDRIGFCFGEEVSVSLDPVQTPAPAIGGQVTWSGPGVNQNGVFSSQGLNPGEYNLIYTYVEGICSFMDTVIVQVSGLPEFNLNTEDPTCYLDRFGILIPEITDGFGPFDGEVIGGPNINFSWDPETMLEDLPPGTYQVIISDVNGCTNTGNFVINDVIEPTVDINGADTQIVGEPENYFFNVEPESLGISFDSIVWTLNGAVFCSGLECLDVTLDEQEDALDTLCVQLFYNEGCFIETCKPVRIREIKQFYIPNIFSPNGDDNNDDLRFYTNNEAAIVHDVAIYDRWGNLLSYREIDEVVGTEEEISSGDSAMNDVFLWDGHVANNVQGQNPRAGERVQPGVYVYKINYTLDPVNNGQPEVVAGDVTILR